MLTLKKLLENALRFETDVVLNILCVADFTCMDGWRKCDPNFILISINWWVFVKTFSKLVSLTIIMCLFTQNISSKHIEGLSTQQHWSNLHKHHFGDFGQKLFWILTVGSSSLGNCRFYCPRSFQSIERFNMFTVIFLKCLKTVFKIALKPAWKGIACE